jgi:uncharacterized repeat protein (TIGR03803 family)
LHPEVPVIKTSTHCRFTTAVLVLAIVVTVPAHAQTFSVLYNFGTNAGDPLRPGYPQIVAQGRDGNLYSITGIGGTGNSGTAFLITPAGTLTVLHNFEGESPVGLTLGTDGNFYGTSFINLGGTIFKITPAGALTVLYTFTSGSDGTDPNNAPIQGIDGNFYGTTAGCTINGCIYNPTVYKVTPAGKLKTIYTWSSRNISPNPLVQGTDGNIYGTTGSGSANGYGTVFKITTAGKLTTLYSFDYTNGANPSGALVQGSDGNFYGTAGGGTANGVAFKITPSGKLTVLHNFGAVAGDGQNPIAGLVQATDGNFYGVANAGGTMGYGIIFRVSSTGSLTVLYNFDNTTGANPQVTPVQNTNGVMYGGTASGGAHG